MSEVLLTNIFFMITAAAVVLVTGGILLMLWYVIPIVRDIRDIIGKLRKAGEDVERDFQALRANLREEGSKGKMIVDTALRFVAAKIGAKPKPKRKDEEKTVNK